MPRPQHDEDTLRRLTDEELAQMQLEASAGNAPPDEPVDLLPWDYGQHDRGQVPPSMSDPNLIPPHGLVGTGDFITSRNSGATAMDLGRQFTEMQMDGQQRPLPRASSEGLLDRELQLSPEFQPGAPFPWASPAGGHSAPARTITVEPNAVAATRPDRPVTDTGVTNLGAESYQPGMPMATEPLYEVPGPYSPRSDVREARQGLTQQGLAEAENERLKGRLLLEENRIQEQMKGIDEAERLRTALAAQSLNTRVNAFDARQAELEDRIRSTHIDPERFWYRDSEGHDTTQRRNTGNGERQMDIAGPSTAKRIGWTIATFISGLGQAMQQAGGNYGARNQVLDQLNKAIDQDIMAQRADLDNIKDAAHIGNNILAQSLMAHREVATAYDAARLAALNNVERQVGQMQRLYGSAQSQQNAQALLGMVAQQRAQIQNQMMSRFSQEANRDAEAQARINLMDTGMRLKAGKKTPTEIQRENIEALQRSSEKEADRIFDAIKQKMKDGTYRPTGEVELEEQLLNVLGSLNPRGTPLESDENIARGRVIFHGRLGGLGADFRHPGALDNDDNLEANRKAIKNIIRQKIQALYVAKRAPNE